MPVAAARQGEPVASLGTRITSEMAAMRSFSRVDSLRARVPSPVTFAEEGETRGAGSTMSLVASARKPGKISAVLSMPSADRTAPSASELVTESRRRAPASGSPAAAHVVPPSPSAEGGEAAGPAPPRMLSGASGARVLSAIVTSDRSCWWSGPSPPDCAPPPPLTARALPKAACGVPGRRGGVAGRHARRRRLRMPSAPSGTRRFMLDT